VAISEEAKVKTALLIDDEAYFRKFVGQTLKKERIGKVVEARDGCEGVKLFQEHHPDIVLLDISMPHMDGLHTLAELRRLSASVPIIMLTSVSEEKVVEECVKQGATFFIRKDVPAQQLGPALHAALHDHLET
jgi:two-component system, chemotaxis family, chemotaxis protein CheY